MNEIEQRRQTLQETMVFMGALASGIEELVGRPANAMAYVAGKSLGKELSASAEQTDDLEEALQRVRQVLLDNDCLWHFEPFKRKAETQLVTRDEDGLDVIQIVFRDCMIRQTLARFGHDQKGSLCNMMYGFFAGALEAIMGRGSKLEIVHAGENACLKRLIMRR